MDSLPTFESALWTVTALRQSLVADVGADKAGTAFYMFLYAVTDAGWKEVRGSILKWAHAMQGRKVIAYIGTDHAVTEPEAVRHMRDDGVEVRLMVRYRGVFHPKVYWLSGPTEHSVWVGSNNLTGDGLLHNVEFAILLKSDTPHPMLAKWHENIHAASDLLTDSSFDSYEAERRDFAVKRSQAGTFTWSKREEPSLPASTRHATRGQVTSAPTRATRGDLMVQVMPLETGPDGKQMQLPKEAAVSFFGLPDRIGASGQFTLTPAGTADSRTLTMTIFGNNSVRLSINELDYRDRPCVIVFHPVGSHRYEFDIVQRSIFPSRYASILAVCTRQTRSGSRRWGIA